MINEKQKVPAFNNGFNFVPEVEILDTVDHIERDGVVPLKSQIKAFKEAGVLLRATRAIQYDEGANTNDFDKIDTITRDCKDYSDMSELIARSEATSRAVAALAAQASEKKVEESSTKVDTTSTEKTE